MGGLRIIVDLCYYSVCMEDKVDEPSEPPSCRRKVARVVDTVLGWLGCRCDRYSPHPICVRAAPIPGVVFVLGAICDADSCPKTLPYEHERL